MSEQEHCSIGSTPATPLAPRDSSMTTTTANTIYIKLRLGLPSSEFSDKKAGNGFSLFGKDLKDETNNGFSQNPLKNIFSDTERGIFDRETEEYLRRCGRVTVQSRAMEEVKQHLSSTKKKKLYYELENQYFGDVNFLESSTSHEASGISVCTKHDVPYDVVKERVGS
ncbi:Auxin-responsive protein [Forsythia ovata]|uniref:Auxin-responsive protein n=1 Tax=Forsythia ovata TaxID=205694 RepID=A0ABD1VLI7_9LAMI